MSFSAWARSGAAFRKTRRTLAASLLATIIVVGATACREKTPAESLEHAQQLLDQRQTAQAVLELKKLVNKAPKDATAPTAHLLLARFYTNQGNGPRALEELEAAWKLAGPDDDRGREAIEAIVQIRTQLKDFEGALESIDEAIAASADKDAAMADSWRVRRGEFLLGTSTDATVVAEAEGSLRTMSLDHADAGTRGFARETLANYYKRKGDFTAANGVYAAYLEKYPDDTIRNQLRLAMAVNRWESGEKAEARVAFDEAAAAVVAEADAELDKQARARMLLDLSQFYRLIGDLDGAEKLMLRVMGENAMSRLAIDTQFGISEMYVGAGLQQGDDVLYEKGLAVLDRIQRENPGSNLEMSAQRYADEARAIHKRLAEARDAATSATATGAPPSAS